MGVPRAVIKSRVLGPPNSEVVLEFQRDRRVFKVTLLRTSGFAATHSALAATDQSGVVEHRKDRGKDPALGDGKTAAQAQLLSSNVRNSVSGSATSQAENGDREQCLERSARSQAAERFRGPCLQTRSEEMDAIETATQTEPGMPRGGIGTDRRRVWASQRYRAAARTSCQPVAWTECKK